MVIDNTKKLLVTISDKNYLNISKQFFKTILERGFWLNDLMLITEEGVEDKNLDWFNNNGIIIKKFPFYYSKKNWYSILPDGVKNPIVSSKIYLFANEFRIWEKILYIDSDVIIRYPLNKITNINIFGAVRNRNGLFLHRQFQYNKDAVKLYNDLKNNYNLFSPAFNAGVFCFNPNRVEKNIKDKFNLLFQKYSSIATFSEQSILNLLFCNKWESLPKYYNYCVNRDINIYKTDPKKIMGVVLHFNGNYKPWFKDTAFYEEWIQKSYQRKFNNEIEMKEIGKNFYFKYFMYRVYFFLKIIFSFKIYYFFRHILVNYFPEVFILIKNKFYEKNA